jgi:hypothetical protein
LTGFIPMFPANSSSCLYACTADRSAATSPDCNQPFWIPKTSPSNCSLPISYPFSWGSAQDRSCNQGTHLEKQSNKLFPLVLNS